jgi:hypothetical protein
VYIPLNGLGRSQPSQNQIRRHQMTNPVDAVKEWMLQIALKKAGLFAGKAVVGIVTGVKIAPVLAQLGVTVDPATMAGGIATLLGALLTILQNWIKIKYGVKWL